MSKQIATIIKFFKKGHLMPEDIGGPTWTAPEVHCRIQSLRRALRRQAPHLTIKSLGHNKGWIMEDNSEAN